MLAVKSILNLSGMGQMGSEEHIPPHSYRALGIGTRSPAPEKLFCIPHCLKDTTTCSVTDQTQYFNLTAVTQELTDYSLW